MPPIALSPVVLPAGTPLRRESPRPPALRNAAYADQFDWDTLFYDVYRVGRHVVFQGPPLFNLAAPWLAAPAFQGRLGPLFPRARRIERNRASEIWLNSEAERLTIAGPLGRFDIAVQPDLADRYAGRRVIHTLSKDNEPRWIADWIRFYRAVHGADAVLLYDNASTRYTAAGLEGELRGQFPDMVIDVVHWPFRYGPQGGLAGAVDGIEAPWDSDYCQTGSMQHARHRFLRRARSVLNVDIDELVIGPGSIFAATERARGRFVKFAGQWVSAATPHGAGVADCRHADFRWRDLEEQETCPPKWCVVPAACHAVKHTWSVHNLFGARANRRVAAEWSYRHMKGISNNWKYDRWDAGSFDPARFVPDAPLAAAMDFAGLWAGPGSGALTPGGPAPRSAAA
jgi:hypothetical protein